MECILICNSGTGLYRWFAGCLCVCVCYPWGNLMLSCLTGHWKHTLGNVAMIGAPWQTYPTKQGRFAASFWFHVIAKNPLLFGETSFCFNEILSDIAVIYFTTSTSNPWHFLHIFKKIQKYPLVVLHGRMQAMLLTIWLSPILWRQQFLMMCGGLGHEGSEVTVDSLGMFILTYTNHFLQNPQVYLTYEKNM